MALTPDQQAQACPTCAADPSAAPGRYCPRLRCRCGHPPCHAFASWSPLPDALENVTHLPAQPRKRKV